jgi:hypothetical protein
MIDYGIRKVIAKQKGPHGEYYFIMLPSKYCKSFNIQKGVAFKIFSTKKGDMILRRVR